ELCQRLGAVVRRVGAIAHHDDRRLERVDLPPKLLEAVGCGPETGPRLAEDRIPAPAEIAEDNLAIGIACGQQGLDVVRGLGPFDQRVADEHHAVAVEQLEPAGRSLLQVRPAGTDFGLAGELESRLTFRSLPAEGTYVRFHPGGKGSRDQSDAGQ